MGKVTALIKEAVEDSNWYESLNKIIKSAWEQALIKVVKNKKVMSPT